MYLSANVLQDSSATSVTLDIECCAFAPRCVRPVHVGIDKWFARSSLSINSGKDSGYNKDASTQIREQTGQLSVNQLDEDRDGREIVCESRMFRIPY